MNTILHNEFERLFGTDTYGDVWSAMMKTSPEFSETWYKEHPELCHEKHPATCAQTADAIARQHNKRLLMDAVRVIEKGHYNNEIRNCLATIARAGGDEGLARQIESLPDRTTMGTTESWCLAALHLYVRVELERMTCQRCAICENETPGVEA